MDQKEFCLKFNSYSDVFQGTFAALLRNEHFTDVTLSCESQTIKCHRIVLSACSAYFETVLLDAAHPHPIVILKDVRYRDMQALVKFMYTGEVTVAQAQINSLIKVADLLKIKGIAEPDEASNSVKADREPLPERLSSTPPHKRKRGETDPENNLFQDPIQDVVPSSKRVNSVPLAVSTEQSSSSSSTIQVQPEETSASPLLVAGESGGGEPGPSTGLNPSGRHDRVEYVPPPLPNSEVPEEPHTSPQFAIHEEPALEHPFERPVSNNSGITARMLYTKTITDFCDTFPLLEIYEHVEDGSPTRPIIPEPVNERSRSFPEDSGVFSPDYQEFRPMRLRMQEDQACYPAHSTYHRSTENLADRHEPDWRTGQATTVRQPRSYFPIYDDDDPIFRAPSAYVEPSRSLSSPPSISEPHRPTIRVVPSSQTYNLPPIEKVDKAPRDSNIYEQVALQSPTEKGFYSSRPKSVYTAFRPESDPNPRNSSQKEYRPITGYRGPTTTDRMVARPVPRSTPALDLTTHSVVEFETSRGDSRQDHFRKEFLYLMEEMGLSHSSGPTKELVWMIGELLKWDQKKIQEHRICAKGEVKRMRLV